MEPAVRALIDLLRSPDAAVVERVARALGALEDPAALGALIQARDTEVEVEVREAKQRAIDALCARVDQGQLLLSVLAHPRGPAPSTTAVADAVALLSELANRPDQRDRLRAVNALDQLRDASALPALAAALHDPEAEVRALAAGAIAALGLASPAQRRGAWSLLRRAAHDPAPSVQLAAQRGLDALEALRDDPGEALRARLRSATPEEATEILVARGRALTGRPLARSEWAEIAAALGTVRAGAPLLDLLGRATERTHALRALRLARSLSRPKQRGGARPIHAALSPTFFAMGLDDDSYGCDCPTCCPVDDDWRAFVAPHGQRWPEVLPVDALQALVIAHADLLEQPVTPRDFTQLRARLSNATRLDLEAAFGARAGGLPEELQAFLDRHALHAFFGASAPEPARTGPELAAIELHWLLAQRAIEGAVDWEAVGHWLAVRLVQAPDPDPMEQRALLLAFMRFVRRAPRATMSALGPAIARMHPGWLALLPWLHARRGKDEWLALLQASIGSMLVLRQLHHNLADTHAQRCPPPAQPYHVAPRELLTSGGGTLRRMDYPSFRVVSRPAISLVRADTLAVLTGLCGELTATHEAIAGADAHTLLHTLFAQGGHEVFARLPEPQQRAVARAVERHTIAFVMLDNVVFASAPEPVRIRGKHVRRFLVEQFTGDVPADLAALRARFDLDRVKEGLVHALIDRLHEPCPEQPAARAALKEGMIHALRTVAMSHGIAPITAASPGEEPSLAARRLIDHLVQQVVHAPLELAQALGLPHEQGLPKLMGGHSTTLERRFRQALRDAQSSSRVAGEGGSGEQAGETFSCRPISKVAALARGELGRDCSSSSVPLRALSPHHVYYGIFQGEQQRPGYMTVYEAWAETAGERRPVLCLETINVPIGAFDPIQQDLLILFDAIAASRGLFPRVVLITGIGTWNYQNGFLLQGARRFRKGQPVQLTPADPIAWRLHEMSSGETAYYSAFSRDGLARSGEFRLLAPFDPEIDPVQPENLAEAGRLAALKPRELQITARTAEGPIGFISAYPEIF